ncbi:hypothetical protein BDY24DRAFT_402536 [Mrakia frigida]|uniref:uncharacterized protein n=1 Tax=Mrakia frigida TaxID=29902 RepID=UPI003FCC0CD7
MATNDSSETVSKMLAETSLRHRRSASLKRRSASAAPSGPPPPVPPLPSTSTLPQPSSSAAAPKLFSARRTHFPTPLVLRQDHSAFPRSPVPKSIVRGGGYSPRVKKGTRMAAGVQALDATRARLGRDDFLPTHLKSEEGKERERERERERDSTTDHGGGVSSGKCSRHRSPPPSSSGRDKMKAHGERRSRSAVAGGEGSRAASSSRTRRTSTDVGRVTLPPPPSPILKRDSTFTSAASSSRGVPTTTGELTPVFLSDAEGLIPRQPASIFRPTLVSPTTITTTSILQSTDILSPPPSRRESSYERRASLSAVCSVFQRSSFSTSSAHFSDDPSSHPVLPQIRRPSIALDGSSSATYTQRSAGGGPTFVDGSALTQSLQKALGGGGDRSVRPFSPPPTAPSSFVPPRFPTANLPAPSSSVPTREIAKRRLSQPPMPTTNKTTTTTPVKSRPIVCPAPGRGGGGGWTDGG